MASKKPKRRSQLSPRERALKCLDNGKHRDALAWAEGIGPTEDLNDLLAAAQIFQASEDLAKVREVYQQLSRLQPDERNWKIAVACVLAQTGNSEELIRHLKTADIESLDAGELILLAAASANGKHSQMSVEYYCRACDQAIQAGDTKRLAEASFPLAATLTEIGERQEAGKVLRSLIESESDNETLSQAWFNLGVITEADEPETAVHAYQQSLSISPSYGLPIPNLAILLTRLGKLDQAIEFLKPVVDRQIDLPRSAVLLASASRLNGQLDQAIQTLTTVVNDAPESPSTELAWEMLVRILIENGETSSAIERCQSWLIHNPASSIAAHMLAATQGENVPERASSAYVANTFDSFADSFDAVLTNLEYRAPQLVGHLAGQTLGPPKSDLRILDAGCGTGLAGPFLRPFAAELVGVDLSQKMLGHARARDCYDDLIVADLLDILADEKAKEKEGSRFDVIVAADTFNYFGDLSDLIPACFAALNRDGWLIFTLELGDTYGETYQLEAHGRYSHPPGYLMEQLGQCGIEGGEMHRVVLRKENGQDVVGLLVAAQLPDPADENDLE